MQCCILPGGNDHILSRTSCIVTCEANLKNGLKNESLFYGTPPPLSRILLITAHLRSEDKGQPGS